MKVLNTGSYLEINKQLLTIYATRATVCDLSWYVKGVFLSLRFFLVSTYVVCERLSVRHKLAGVVENLVQKSQLTLFWDLVPRTPPPPPPRKLKFRQILAFQDFSLLTCGEYQPPPHPKFEI